MESDDFEAALAALPEGYSEGIYEGRRYGVSFRRSDDERRNSLFARELAGTDIACFNLYRLGSGIASLNSNSGGLARQRLDHGKAVFRYAAHPVDPPFFGILARHNMLTQWGKSLGFQFLQDWRKSLGKRCAGISDKHDLKTNCKQIAAYFVWSSEEA
jgi:hypothetical protein